MISGGTAIATERPCRHSEVGRFSHVGAVNTDTLLLYKRACRCNRQIRRIDDGYGAPGKREFMSVHVRRSPIRAERLPYLAEGLNDSHQGNGEKRNPGGLAEMCHRGS